jgi:hypothetical protein
VNRLEWVILNGLPHRRTVGLDAETIAKLEEEILHESTPSSENDTSTVKSRLPVGFFDEPQKKSAPSSNPTSRPEPTAAQTDSSPSQLSDEWEKFQSSIRQHTEEDEKTETLSTFDFASEQLDHRSVFMAKLDELKRQSSQLQQHKWTGTPSDSFTVHSPSSVAINSTATQIVDSASEGESNDEEDDNEELDWRSKTY